MYNLRRIGSVVQIMLVSLLPLCVQDNHIKNMCVSISHRALRWRSQGWKSAALHHCLAPREMDCGQIQFTHFLFMSVQYNRINRSFFYAKRGKEKKAKKRLYSMQRLSVK